MSKFSFEKGQKIDLSDLKFYDDPIKNEILKIVIGKLVKKHLKGGVRESDLELLFNRDDPKSLGEYFALKEVYDAKSKKFPEPVKRIETEVKVEEVKKPSFTDIIEEREKADIKLLIKEADQLKDLIKLVPKVPEVEITNSSDRVAELKNDLKAEREELRIAQDSYYETNNKGDYVVSDEGERRELEERMYIVRRNIDDITQNLDKEKKKYKKLKLREQQLEESKKMLDEKLKSTQEKLKNKEELKQKLEEKTEKKRKQDLESQNQAKLVLKQKSLFPNIQNLRQEQQTLTKQKKKASRKK